MESFSSDDTTNRKHTADDGKYDIEFTTSKQIHNNTNVNLDKSILRNMLIDDQKKTKETGSDDSNSSREWTFGHMHITRSLIIFITNVIFSTTLIIFCILKLSHPSLTNNDKLLYVNILTSTVSLYSPSPFQNNRKK